MTTFYRDKGNYSRLIDDDGAGTIYSGKAPFGSLKSESKWQIKKIATVSTLTSVYWADSNDNFDNIWDNRASLPYA